MQVDTFKVNKWTRLDDTGAVFGLTRIEGEGLVSFKRRILNAYVDKMDATQNGLLNSILSGLGLEKRRAIVMSAKDGVDLQADYPKRAILKLDNKLLICSSYNSLTDYVSDLSVELREEPYLSITEVVEYINTFSELYQAELITTNEVGGLGADYFRLAKGFTLINTSSLKTYTHNIVPTTRVLLPHKNICETSLLFTDPRTYLTEIETEEELNNVPGNYFVDYDEGVIVSASLSARNSQVLYTYHQEPFTLFHSPVAVSRIFTRDSMKYLFDETGMFEYDTEDEMTEPGLPKAEMVDITYELMRAARVYWGA